MLKVIDDGVLITLNGTPKNTLYWFSLGLLVLAVVVAVVAMVAPVQITIGFMAVFAVLIFIFNLYKNRQKYQSDIVSGQIVIKNRAFVFEGRTIKLSEQAYIHLTDSKLIIKDLGRVWHISGFDDVKECHVAQSVLEGKALEKQERAIRIL